MVMPRQQTLIYESGERHSSFYLLEHRRKIDGTYIIGDSIIVNTVAKKANRPPSETNFNISRYRSLSSASDENFITPQQLSQSTAKLPK